MLLHSPSPVVSHRFADFYSGRFFSTCPNAQHLNRSPPQRMPQHRNSRHHPPRQFPAPWDCSRIKGWNPYMRNICVSGTRRAPSSTQTSGSPAECRFVRLQVDLFMVVDGLRHGGISTTPDNILKLEVSFKNDLQ